MEGDSKSKRPATELEQRALREMIDADGERAALKALGLSRMGAYRLLAGLPVTSGTRAVVREALRAA